MAAPPEARAVVWAGHLLAVFGPHGTTPHRHVAGQFAVGLDGPPRVLGAMHEVLRAAGLEPSELDEAQVAPSGEAIRAELRSDQLHGHALVESARSGSLSSGWSADLETIDAQGETGRAFRFAAQAILPNLGNLDQRLMSDVGFAELTAPPATGAYQPIFGRVPDATTR